MDNNPIAPFHMYTDEYILWMENFKNTNSTTITKIITWVLGGMSGIGTIFIILALVLKGKYVFLNLAAFLGGCTLFTALIVVFALSLQQKRKPATTYYVTNFRLIELLEGKPQTIQFGYLKNLKIVEIDTSSNNPTFLEFIWINSADTDSILSGFYDINNCRKVYDTIRNQQKELKRRTYNYDFIVQ